MWKAFQRADTNMAPKHLKKVKDIDEFNQQEELSKLGEGNYASEDEQKYADWGLAALTPEQRERCQAISPFDIIQITRGYMTYKPRKEETEKAFKMIQDWRDKVDFHKILDAPHPLAKEFHTKLWVEKVYGYDKWGHIILGFKFQQVDVNALAEIKEEDLMRIVGQKLAAIQHLKIDKMKETGQQRYKATYVIDLTGAGMGLLSGKRRGMIKKIMDYGSDYFPESIWKIYTINTPFGVRMGWGAVRPFIHPVTQAKINITEGTKTCLSKLTENDGCTLDQLPEIVGGTHAGRGLYDVIMDVVAQKQRREADSGGRKTPPGTLL